MAPTEENAAERDLVRISRNDAGVNIQYLEDAPAGTIAVEVDHGVVTVVSPLQELEELEKLASDLQNDLTGALLDFLDRVLPAAYAPKGDRILMKVLEEGFTRTKGSLWVVNDAQPDRGMILRMSAGAQKFEPTLAPGDVVVFSRHSGQPVEIGGQTFRLIAVRDILATIEV